MKFKISNFRNKENKVEEVVFEIQEMDYIDFYDLKTQFSMGAMKFSEWASSVIKESIVSPREAQSIDFFRKSPKVLDVLMKKISNISSEGLEEVLISEIKEEEEQKEQQN